MNTNYDQMTDAELSEAFAVKVAGWVRKGKVAGDVFTYDKWHDEHGGCCDFDGGLIVPTFATSADAVLPLLEKYFVETSYVWTQLFAAWSVWIRPPHGSGGKPAVIGHGSHATFPRAACIALLRAKDSK